MYNVRIYMKIDFIWDENKNTKNKRKHGISFEEATTVFYNIPLEIFYDPDHSDHDDRYIAIGVSNSGRILLFVHCENKNETKFRIISTLKDSKKEKHTILGRLQ